VLRALPKVTFRFASFSAAMAPQRSPDGTTSFVTIEPMILGLPFVVDDHDGAPVGRSRRSARISI
jgi:hypothetical protein